MLFSTQQFLVFFSLVGLVYWRTPALRLRIAWLVGASVVFYASWNHWLALVIVVSTTLDYWVARGIEASRSARVRRALLLVSVTSNLALLTYFKYAKFFLHSFEAVLAELGSVARLPSLAVILPIGISFYTFEAISYVVDVYRRRACAERRLDHLLLFILFFPHLVAGPIVRPRHFLPQIPRRKRWDWLRAQLGVELFLRGLFKKMAIADRMALAVDPVFADPRHYGSSAARLAVAAYAIQIFCDFSGYTDMALGTAHLLGFKLPQNFRAPYWAANPSDFWRRWHISLSSWLRDYLYVPLGGNRGTVLATARNLIVTMTLGGLWHGAQWSFVIWGLAHGMLLLAHRMVVWLGERIPRFGALTTTPPARLLGSLATVASVWVLWIVFRARALADSWTILRRAVSLHAGIAPPLPALVVGCGFLLVMIEHQLIRLPPPGRRGVRVTAPVTGLAYAVALLLALLLAPDSGKAFIYFQF